MLVSSMTKPFVAVALADPARGMASDSSQCEGGSRSSRSNHSLDDAPGGLDGIEVGGIRREIFDPDAALLEYGADARVVMGLCVIEYDNIPRHQFRYQAVLQPADEAVAIGGFEEACSGDPTLKSKRAEHGQVVAPIHRSWVEQLVAFDDPAMRPSHRKIRARFVEKHEMRWVHFSDAPQESRPLYLDIRSVAFRRPRAFFLKTYPARARARWMLDRCTRRLRSTRLLYAAVSSNVVESGLACNSSSSVFGSTGEKLPPPQADGSTLPVSRYRRTQRSSVALPTSNRSATSSYEPSPASYARTARSRSSFGCPFGIILLDHELPIVSTELGD